MAQEVVKELLDRCSLAVTLVVHVLQQSLAQINLTQLVLIQAHQVHVQILLIKLIAQIVQTEHLY